MNRLQNFHNIYALIFMLIHALFSQYFKRILYILYIECIFSAASQQVTE